MTRRETGRVALGSCAVIVGLLACKAESSPPAGSPGLSAEGQHAPQPAGLTVKDLGTRGHNIIWLVVDAMRADHLGCYGYPKPTTPFLDELAAESLVFTSAYTNAPWTRSATASMLTGLYPSAHQTQSDRSKLPAGIRTLAEELRDLGYRTAAVVGNGNASSIANLDRGFDDYIDTVTHWEGLPTAAQVFDDAIDWLRNRRPADKPWFLFLFVVDVHDPYHAPAEYEKQWLGDFKGEPRRRAHWEYKNDYPEEERLSMIALYDAAVRYTDDQTRRLFDQVKQLGLYDRSTIVVTADHGEAFGEHGYYLHSYHHHEEFLHVPLIVRSPAWKGSGEIPHLVQHVDLAPTLITLAGGTPRTDLPGVHLGDLLRKDGAPERVAISEFNEFGVRRSAIFDQRYKVILQLPASREEFAARSLKPEWLPSVSFDREGFKIYDRQRDPGEQDNLAPDRIPPRAEQLLEELRAYMQAAPRPNQEVDPKAVPQAVLDDLRSLGYVQ